MSNLDILRLLRALMTEVDGQRAFIRVVSKFVLYFIYRERVVNSDRTCPEFGECFTDAGGSKTLRCAPSRDVGIAIVSEPARTTWLFGD